MSKDNKKCKVVDGKEICEDEQDETPQENGKPEKVERKKKQKDNCRILSDDKGRKLQICGEGDDMSANLLDSEFRKPSDR